MNNFPIARVKDNEQQQTLLTEAIANNLSLNQIKERIKKLNSIWDLGF